VLKKLQIGPDRQVEWIVEGNTARVIPLPSDPVKIFRGSGKKGAVRRLLKKESWAGAKMALRGVFVLDTAALLALHSQHGAVSLCIFLKLGVI